MRSQLLYLKRWPDFSKESELSDVRNVARICALLSRKPTVGFLVHRAVDLPSDATDALLHRLLLAQCIGLFQADTSQTSLNEPGAAALKDRESSAPVPALRTGQAAPSLLRKVWGRFIPN